MLGFGVNEDAQANCRSGVQRPALRGTGGSHLIGADMDRLKLSLRCALLVAPLRAVDRKRHGARRWPLRQLAPETLVRQLAQPSWACCSDADGFAVSDPNWESHDGHYRVRLDGEWVDVPDEAVITEPNRAGHTMVWPVKTAFGISIRCFMPGSMI